MPEGTTLMSDAVTMKMTLPKIPDIELVALEGLDRLARHLGIPDGKIGEARIIVTEAIINALEHSGEKNPSVRLEFTMTTKELSVFVRDYGKGFEPGAVELALLVLERRIGDDAPRDFVIGNAKPHLPCAFVQAGFGDHLAQNLPRHAAGHRLVRRDHMAGLPAEHLQRVVVGLPELLDRDFGVTDLGERRAAEAAKNVVDAPDREAHSEQAHDHAHHGAAKPIGGGFADTSKH